MNKEIFYLHRYPIEYESKLFPSMKRIFEILKGKINYVSMKSISRKDSTLRKSANVIELPFKIDPLNEKDKIMKTILYWLYSPIMLYKIKKTNPDLIICKELLPFIPSMAGRIGCPIVIEVTDWWLSAFLNKNRIGSRIAEFIEELQVKDWVKLPCILIAHTESEKKILVKQGFPIERIRISHYPLFESTYFPIKEKNLRKKLNLPGKKWIAAVHGIMHPNKGYDELLKFWKEAIKKHPDWILLIIGGGGREKWCKEEVKRLGISKNVIMTGWLPSHDDVNKHLNAVDCLLVTRKNSRENIGSTPSSLFHGLSLAKPVAAVGLPGMAEVIKDRKNGYLYKPGNYASFLNTLEEIYNNPGKANRIARLGIKTGKKFFNPEESAKSFVSAMNDAIKIYGKNK